MRQIPIKLPPSFEDALGYSHHLKWVAFYWEPCGDEAMFADGLVAGDGNWWGYKAFVEHPRVSPWLVDYDLGSSDDEAKHWLLCNLETREIYVGERKEVAVFLRSKVAGILPELPQVELSPKEITEMLNKVLEEIREVPAPSIEEIEEKMRRDQEAVERMMAELN